MTPSRACLPLLSRFWSLKSMCAQAFPRLTELTIGGECPFIDISHTLSKTALPFLTPSPYPLSESQKARPGLLAQAQAQTHSQIRTQSHSPAVLKCMRESRRSVGRDGYSHVDSGRAKNNAEWLSVEAATLRYHGANTAQLRRLVAGLRCLQRLLSERK